MFTDEEFIVVDRWKMLRRNLAAVLIALLVGLTTVPAMAQVVAPVSAPAGPAAPVTSLAEGYIIGPGDVIEVAVLGREDFRARVPVDIDGTIQLPLIKSIPAQNRTVLQLREDIRIALMGGGYFADPVVSANVVTYASRYVIVLGEVTTPGLLPVDRDYRISEILARVGGARPNGADEVTLTRVNGETRKLSISDISTGGGDADPIVNPGDKVFIAAAPQFFVYGQVNAPGSYRIDRGMTVRKALARSGGLTSLGSEKRVKVFRDGNEVKIGPSELIKEGDTIVVGERFF